MSIVRKLVTSALLAGSFLAIGASDAFATCTSASTCARQLACMPGVQLVKESNKIGHCQQNIAADTDTPTCVGKGPLPKNWVWASTYSYQGKKGMCVTKDNKGAVSDTNPDAITCTSGYSFNSTTGLCTLPAQTKYIVPSLGTSPVSTALTGSCSSAASCKREIKCSASYNTVATGVSYYCTKTEAGSSKTPTCVGKGPLPKNWVWASTYSYQGKKGMCVTKDNKGAVSDTNPDAITCTSGYSFNSAAGLCEKPGSTYFATPLLDN